MNESQWWLCSAPEGILSWLGPKADGRCLRLFCCACCRLIWPIIPIGASRKAVETSERYADGLVSEAVLSAAEASARSVPSWGAGGWLAAWAAAEAAGFDAEAAAEWVPGSAAEAAGEAVARAALASDDSMPVHEAAAAAWRQQRQLQCGLLRDIFVDPMLRVVTIDPRCLRWKNGAVAQAAQASYDRGGCEELSYLANLLEQAGCDNENILDHCRAGSGHVRGCWVLDLLLGRRNAPGHENDFLMRPPGVRTSFVESRSPRGLRRIPQASAELARA
jgi:hypothetical protein